MRVILLDIEGTTTPIRFVYDVLFPYARARMRAFIASHIDQPDFSSTLHALIQESAVEHANDASAPSLDGVTEDAARADRVADFALWLMDHDRKSTPLKEIQGQIWQEGYVQGEILGEVYADVPAAMQRWKNNGLRVAIYSSGSVQAQKLIFGYSTAGDLRAHIDAYFDTTTGPKKEAQSYVDIARALDANPEDILFLSDNDAELRAARAAGVQVRLAVRPGNAPVEGDAFVRVQDFEPERIGV